MRLAGAAGRWLADRRVPLLAALLGMALALPSLGAGLQGDDYVHQVILSRTPAFAEFSTSRLDLFSFLDGDRARTRRLMDLGVVPWWTLEDARLAFWRPLGALSHWLDHRLWPARPRLMHAQSILWYGALVAAVALLYRRLMGAAGAAGLAALLYAVDAAHGFAVGWLANRNALLGAFFAALSLLAHDRWRRGAWRPGAALAPLCFLLALLSAEAALAALGYLLAHALFLDAGRARARCLALVPYALAALLWQLTYWQMGYGVRGVSPFYVNPMLEPGLFARALVERGPILLLAQWALPSLEGQARALRPPPALAWMAGLAFLAWLALALAGLLRRSAVARFWGAGQLLALPLACATLPHGRQLLFVGLGATGLLALLLADLADGLRQPRASLWRQGPALALGAFLLVVHAVLAPLELLAAARGAVHYERLIAGFAASLPGDPAVANQTLVLVNPPDAYFADLSRFSRAWRGEPAPARTLRLASAATPVEVSRPDARTLVLRPEGGLFPDPLNRVFRGEDAPMASGERVVLGLATIEVRAVTKDGRPAEVAFSFTLPLDDPSLRWLAWRREGDGGRYVPFTPPAIGESVRL